MEGPFTTKDLKHAVLISGAPLLARMNTDELQVAIRDALRGLRKSGRVAVEQEAPRGGGYVYRCWAVPKPLVEKTSTVSHTLTKREAFAMAAMQGLLSNPHHARTNDAVMRDAVSAADLLLAALEVSQ
jgi:phage gp16-like protein